MTTKLKMQATSFLDTVWALNVSFFILFYCIYLFIFFMWALNVSRMRWTCQIARGGHKIIIARVGREGVLNWLNTQPWSCTQCSCWFVWPTTRTWFYRCLFRFFRGAPWCTFVPHLSWRQRWRTSPFWCSHPKKTLCTRSPVLIK